MSRKKPAAHASVAGRLGGGADDEREHNPPQQIAGRCPPR
jgi:hypothetical protein